MDKGRKLKRYSRKDYSQLVEFPVEIVGRDGIVRQYTLAESIRLYQRRIASASSRYKDREVIEAEERHCRQRIDQLRKSYFAHFGWAALRVVDNATAVAGEFAGEVASFLRRCLESAATEPELMDFSFIEHGDGCEIYFIREPLERASDGSDGGKPLTHLLYLFRFGHKGGSIEREAFFNFLRVLQKVPREAEGVEKLTAFHHTADCGFILTGQDVLPDPSRNAQILAVDGHGTPALAEEEGLALLRRAKIVLEQGYREQALRLFVAAYEENHYRKEAYIGAASVGDSIGAFADAETAALMGTYYFPEDPTLHYLLAVAYLRRGKPTEARNAIHAAKELAPTAMAPMAVNGLLAVCAGRLHLGAQALKGLPDDIPEGNHFLGELVPWLRIQVNVLRALALGGITLVLTGALFMAQGTAAAALLSLSGSILAAVGAYAWRGQMLRTLKMPGNKGLRMADNAMIERGFDRSGPRQSD